MVNVQGGYYNDWLQSDEIFAYEHGRNFEPNQETILDLFHSVISVKGGPEQDSPNFLIRFPALKHKLDDHGAVKNRQGGFRYICDDLRNRFDSGAIVILLKWKKPCSRHLTEDARLVLQDPDLPQIFSDWS